MLSSRLLSAAKRFSDLPFSPHSAGSLRLLASEAGAQKEGRSVYVLLTGLLGTVGGATWVLEEREIQKATASLERGSKPVAGIDVPADKVLQRKDLQSRLQDLLKPYVCSMSQVDIIFGHEGTGKSEQVKQACRHLDGGTLYLDLQGSSRLGSHILTALTGERSRGLFQSFRDLLRGGVEAHGLYILERAAHNFLQKHDRHAVIAIDHVDPKQCGLGNPSSPLLNVGRAYDPAAPSMRPVIILNDSQLETLRQESEPSTSFRVNAIQDATDDESKNLLLRNSLPSDLANRVVQLVGGRLGHLQEAIKYWVQSSRWLSPMRPNQDTHASVAAHFAEIKKLIFWDLDKQLRIEAAIGLWPSATGDAPVSHQKPTDEDAEQILQLLERINESPLSANAVRREIGEARLLQLLKAQVLGSLPKEGPLEKLGEDLIGFGSPAMQQYFKERLQKSRVTALEEAAQAKRGSNSWTHMIFG